MFASNNNTYQLSQQMQLQDQKLPIKSSSFHFLVCLLEKTNRKIFQTSIPELISNFNDYLKILNRFYLFFVSDNLAEEYQNQISGKRIQIKKQLSDIIYNIEKKLYVLKQFGKSFLKRVEKYKRKYCQEQHQPSVKLQKIDQEVKNIIDYYEEEIKSRSPFMYSNDKTSNKSKVTFSFLNNKQLSAFEEQIRLFYEREKIKDYTPYYSEMNWLFLNKEEKTTNPNGLIREFVDKTCLRCSTHFVNSNPDCRKGNILYNTVISPADSFYPIDSYQMVNYEGYDSIENIVKASMCSMLNEQNGGIILLGCERTTTMIIPKGLYITQKQKDSLQQKIQGSFKKIIPKVEIRKEIFIDFVPVMEIKRQLDSKPALIKQAIPGQYVCRIFLKSVDSNHIYFIKLSPQHLSLEVRQNSQPKTIDQELHYKHLIKKFENSYPNPKRPSTQSNHYCIKCSEHLVGVLAYDKKADGDQSTLNSSTILDNLQYEIKKQQQKHLAKMNKQETPKKQKTPQEYKFWTLVVGDKAATMKILAVFQKEKKNIKILKFQEAEKFKLNKTTWILYHDDKFENIQKIIKNHSIKYKQNDIKLIATNLYLEMTEKMTIYPVHWEDLMKSLKEKFGKKYQKCLKQCVLKPKQGNLIMYFESLQCSIYAYFYLSDIKYKVKFIRGASYFKSNIPNQSTPASNETVLNSPISSPNQFINENLNQSYGFDYNSEYNIPYLPEFDPQLSLYQYDPYANGYYQNSPGYPQGYFHMAGDSSDISQNIGYKNGGYVRTKFRPPQKYNTFYKHH